MRRRQVASTPTPSTEYTQEQLRCRRRAGLSAVYTGTFSLAEEVAAICLPLAERSTRLGDPADITRGPAKMFGPRVDELVNAVHGELISGRVVTWLAEQDALAHLLRTAPHLDLAARKQAVRNLVDLAPRPTEPDIGPASVASGRWATELVDIARAYTDPLADLLARSRPPHDPALRGRVSRSELLNDLLREVDTAAHEFTLRIERAEANTAQRRLMAQTTAQLRACRTRQARSPDPMTNALLPVEFTPPLVTPANPLGLDAATTWTETAEGNALRWLPSGIQLRLRTHRDPGAFGVWDAPWCASPDDLDPDDDLKTGPARANDDPDPFLAMTVWAFDRLQDCGNLSEYDRGQVIERAKNTFALREPLAVETQFATRLLVDAGTPPEIDELVSAVARVEEKFSAAGIVGGLVHARTGLLTHAQNLHLISRDPSEPGVLRTPAGHRWVMSAGYATPLGNRLIGTTQTYDWRDEMTVREAFDHERDHFVAIAERSVIVAYEAVITP